MIELAINNADIRDSVRVLHININAVIRTLKTQPSAGSYPTFAEFTGLLFYEKNEMWSFIGNKK